MKNNIAAGIDGVLVKQLKNIGLKTHKWLLPMLNYCFTHNKIQTIWSKAKIIAILKPGKDSVQQKILCGAKQRTQQKEKAKEWPATR